jgi:hypothetical protein
MRPPVLRGNHVPTVHHPPDPLGAQSLHVHCGTSLLGQKLGTVHVRRAHVHDAGVKYSERVVILTTT